MTTSLMRRMVRALRSTTVGARALAVVVAAGVIVSSCDVHGVAAPGELASIAVTPDATLASGATQQMLAVGRDADGRVVSIAPTWALAAGGGTIAQTGMFTAGLVTGTFPRTVVASVGPISGSASIVVTPGALASIAVVPTPVTLAVATSQQFTAVGQDAAGNIVQFTPSWSVVAGGGTITQAGIFTAGGAPGTYTNTVQASSGGIKAFATVTVTIGPLASIAVTPNPDTLIVGARQQFVAMGKDASGNTVSVAATWSVVAGGGTIDGAGLFTAGGTPGTFTSTVKATSGSLSATATVVVTAGPLARITVTPNPATLAVNGTQQFTAVGADVAGNPVTITPVWSVVAGGGAIDTTGLFTAGTISGTYTNTVRATSGGLSGYATVIVTTGPLASITVTPNPVEMPTNSTAKFVAVGTDANGNVFVISPVWSVANGGGSIDVNTGVFTSTNLSGTFTNTIRATSGTVSGYATVTVTTVLTTITVTPSPSTLPIGGTTQFSAVGSDGSGNIVPITPTWSIVAGGGTISGAGLFIAGTTLGTYASTVMATSGGISGTATVIVTAGPLATITVTPNPVVLAVNGTQRFTAVGTDGGGNVVSIVPTWSVDPLVGGGTVDSDGMFTAGVVAGTFANAVTASASGMTGHATVTIAAGAQTITFAAPATPAVYGSTFAVAPTASSGLTVTVTASGGCSIASGTVTMTSGSMDCVLTATQVGNGTYSAATPVVQTVVATRRAASVTPNAAGKAFGAADPIPLTTGTLAGFLTGDGVTATYGRTAGEAVGSHPISATLAPAGVLGNYTITYNTATFTIGVTAQTITFAASATPAVYGSTFAVAPTSTSGLTVTVTASGGCSIASGTVTMTSGSVDCVLTATQAGDGTYAPAAPVVRTVVATKLAASVTPDAAGKVFSAADPIPLTTGTLSGFLAGDGVTATYSRTAGEAVGSYPISATLAPAGVLGNYTITYNTATFTIGVTAQAITFAAPPTPATYGSTFAVAPTTSSGLTVTVTASGGCSIASGTVTMTSGSVDCVLTATQAGNGTYAAATPVVHTVIANRAQQSIVFGALAGRTFGDAPFVVSATGGGSGNALTFAAGPAGVCTMSGATVTLSGTGACTVTASQAGDANYAAAVDVARVFTVAALGPVAQSITFAAPVTPATYGSTFAVAPTASSGLTVTVTPTGGCSIALGTVTMTSGSVDCVLTATQAGNGTYAAAPDVVHVVVTSRALQPVLTLTVPPSGTVGQGGLTASASGGSGTGALSYASSTGGVCTVNATTGSIAALATGTCSVTATRAADANYQAATSAVGSFPIDVLAQTITFASPATPAAYGSTFVVAPTASSGLTVTVTPTGGCSIALGTVTMTSGSTDCVLTATQAGNGTYAAALPVVHTVTASRASQAVLTLTVPPSGTVGQAGLSASASGGSGTGALSYASSTGGVCTVNATTGSIAALTTGTCSLTATRAADANYLAATSAASSFPIGLTSQTITFAAPATPAVYGSTFVLAPTATSGLTVTLTSTGGCSVALGTVTMTSGSVDCVLTATQAGNGTYAAAPTVVQTVVASRASQAVLALTVPPSGTVGQAGLTASASGGSGTGALSYASSTGGVCTVDATTGSIAALTTGTCSVIATRAADANYLAATSAASSFLIGLTPQTITFAAPATPAAYGSTFVVAPTASSGLGVTVTASGGCSIALGTVTMTSGSTDCVLTATQAGNSTYSAALPVVHTVTASRAAQAAVVLTVPLSGTIAQAGLSASASGGSGTGALSYASSTGVVCTVNATTGSIAALTTGTCSLTATRAADANYLAATSAASSFPIGLTPQTITFAAPATPAVYGSSFVLVAPTASSGLTVAVTPTGGCTISGLTVTMTSGSIGCVLTATQAGNTTWAAAPDVVHVVAASLAPQAAVILTVPPSGTVGAAGLAANASGGSGTGAVSYSSLTAGVCTVNATTGSIAALAAGTCNLTATRAADANYLAATSAVGSFPISLVAQTITFGVLAGKTYGDAPFAVSATGGASGNAVTFAAAPAGVCTVSGTTVTLTGAGACTVTASQAGNGTYAAALDVAQSFTVSAAAQAAVTLTVPLSGTVAQAGLTAVAGGGSGTGAYSYVSSTLGVCTVNATTGSIAALAAGTCSLTATRAADANYLAATSAVGSFPINLVAQTITFAAPATPAAYGSTFVVAPTASSGLTVTVTPTGGCSIALGTVTMTSGSVDCVLTATQAGNGTYAAALAVAHTVVASRAVQAVLTLTAPGGGTVGQAGLTASASGGSGTGALSYASSTGAVCTVNATTGSIVALTVGTCTLTATRATDANYLAVTSAAGSFAVTAGTQAAVALTVPGSATVGEVGLTASASGGSGTGAYSYASSTPGVCTVNAASGNIAAVTVGNCSLTATRAADVNYLVSAASTPQSFMIGLGAAASFGVLGGSGAASACIGSSTVYGNVGMSPSAAISGFPAPCAIVGGSLHLNDATATAAQANVTTVNAALAGMAYTTDLSGQDLGGKDLGPGVYYFSSAAGLSGTLTLTGTATDVWVFKIGSTLITGGGASVTLVGANAGNVYWQVGSSATLGGTNAFKGNIIAAASITLGTGTNLLGRALSKVDVTMDANTITLP